MSTVLLRPTSVCTIAGHTLGINRGTAVLDETTTYATATITTALIDVADLEDMDPREGVRCTLDLAEASFGTSRTLDLGLRSRVVDHTAKTITFTAASDEALLDDWAPLADDTTPSTMAASVRSVINYVLGIVIPGAELLPGAEDAAVSEPTALLWKAGVSAWEFLLALTSAAALRLFCDEQRQWRLVRSSYMVAGSVTALASNSKEGTDTIDREGEAHVTGVIARYRWTDGIGAHEVLDAAGEPGKVEVIEFSTPYPGPGAASFRLNRLRGQGRQQTARSFTRLDTTPGMSAWFIMPGSVTQIGRLQRVEFDLAEAFMLLGARELTEAPDSAWIMLTAGESWLDSPVGESWLEEVA